MSKAEFELLMFTILCDKYREVDSDITPISLALDLGITVQRVDNLLEKMMLKKTEQELAEIPWKQTISYLLENRANAITYNAAERNFSLIIDDDFARYKAMDILRRNDLYFQETSKPKGLVLPEAAFVALAYECCEDQKKKKSFEETVKEHLSKENMGEMLNGKPVIKMLGGLAQGFLLGSVKGLLSERAAKSLGELLDAGKNAVFGGKNK